MVSSLVQGPQGAQQTVLAVRGVDASLGFRSRHMYRVVQKVYGEGQVGHAPAIDPSLRIVAPSTPFSSLQILFPADTAVPMDKLDLGVQCSEQVVGAGGVREVQHQVEVFPCNIFFRFILCIKYILYIYFNIIFFIKGTKQIFDIEIGNIKRMWKPGVNLMAYLSFLPQNIWPEFIIYIPGGH